MKKGLVAGLAKVIGVLLGFALTVVVARSLTVHDAGLFFLGYSLVAALAKFFRLGLDNIILRWFGAEDLSPKAQGYLFKSFIWVSSISIPVAILLVFFSEVIAGEVFQKPEFAVVIRSIAFAVPAIAVFTLVSMAFQGLQRVVLSVFFQNLGVSAIFLLVISMVLNLAPANLDAEMAALIYMASAVLTLFCSLGFWFFQSGTQWLRVGLADTDLWRSSRNLWVVSSMALLVQWSGVLIAGVYLSASELAYLSTAQRTAQVVSFVLIVTNMVVAPRYARLWKEQDIEGIRKLARNSSRLTIMLALPVVIGIYLFASQVMGFFGDGFEAGANLLIVMTLGQFVNVATGSVVYLLVMSGHEADMRRVTLFSGPLAILLAYLFVLLWGGNGAAWAIALSVAVQNIAALVMVRRRLGFWPVA